MYVPAEPDPSKLPDELRLALSAIGGEPTARVPAPTLIRELLTRGLVEWSHGGELRFTEQGRRLFHELQGANQAPDGLKESKSAVLFPADVQPSAIE